jgi:putative transposase
VFEAVLTAIGARIVRTPIRAPCANAIAERWTASACRECLDQVLITSERHLRQAVTPLPRRLSGQQRLSIRK